MANRLLFDRVKLLYENLALSVILTALAASVLAFGFSNSSSIFAKSVWFTGIMLVLVVRTIDYYYWFNRHLDTSFNGDKALVRFHLGSYFTAFCWSIYGLVFFETMTSLEFSTTIIILCSLSAGAATVLVAAGNLSLFYVGLILVPISARALLSEQIGDNIAGTLGVIFTILMAISAKKSAAFTNNALFLKNKNADLLDEQNFLLTQMEEKNLQISQVNATLEKKVESRTHDIYRLSNIDPLTGLSNRKSFSKDFQYLVNKALAQQTFALLFIDLDGFKTINDTHGHAVGDKVLTITAERLSKIIVPGNLMCRWGGDEFIMVLKNASVDDSKTVANTIITALSETMMVDYLHLNIGSTIGIAMYPEHSNNVEELILYADTAMYQQKQTTKSQCLVFSEHMRDTLAREHLLTQGLSEALAKHEFYLVYQPVIDVQKNRVGFCEALLRWHFNGVLVPPDEFIAIAEHHGFIHSIGAWVLQQSCTHAANCALGEQMPISVNISIMQLVHKDIVSVVEQALLVSGLAPHKLHLEVTESIFAEDTDKLLDVIKQLKTLNIKISIDDFGTGFSSLAMLQRLSADIVKVDKSFVHSLQQGGKAIIQATQYMASELNYDVTVEGVETAQELAVIKNTGVKYIQGFYFAKPMRPSEMRVWLESYMAELA